MATAFRIRNNLNQVIQSLVKDGENFVSKRISPREIFDVAEDAMSPAMTSQVQNGILSIIETFDPGPGVPTPYGLTADQNDALDAANAPNASNPFATLNDVPGFNEQVTKTLHVDKNRTDTYTVTGSIERPFKTIMDAVNAIIAAGDNTSSVHYVIQVAPGVYSENVILEDAALAALSIVGSGINATRLTGNIQSTTNNSNMSSLYLHRMLLSGSINVIGDGSNFGGDLEFSYCVVTGTVNLESIVVGGFKNSKIDNAVTFTNLTMGWISSGEGQNPGQTILVQQDDSKPGSTNCYVIIENSVCGTITTQRVGATGTATVQLRNGTRTAALTNGANCNVVFFAGASIQGAFTNNGTASSTPEVYLDGTTYGGGSAWTASPANMKAAIDTLADAVATLKGSAI